MPLRQNQRLLLPTTLLLQVSVSLAAVAGFGVGLVLLWATAMGKADALPFVALAQAHGQVQTMGFVGLFILGTAAQLLPGFLAYPLRHRRRFVGGGLLVAAALILRIVAQPLENSVGRNVALIAYGILEVVGIGLCLTSLADLIKRTLQPPEVWRYLTLIGLGFLIVSAALNLVASIFLASGLVVVPEWLDAAIIEAELPGYVVFSAMGVGRKIFPRFLILQPTRESLVKLGAGSYLVGTLTTVVVSLIGLALGPSVARTADLIGACLGLAGVVLFIEGIGLFHRPIRPSGAPNVTEPARRWIRLAFGWLIVGNAIDALLAARDVLGVTPLTYLEVAAARHALGQGFVLTLLVALSARILPGVSAWAITHPKLVEATIACLTVGAVLRVGGELAARYGEAATTAAAIGGTLGTLGFLAFAVLVVGTIGAFPRRRDAPRKTVS